jgi:hypothetical protein
MSATQVQLDAAFKAVTPLVDADISDAENIAPVFMRPQVDQSVQAHRAQIDVYVKALLKTGVNAALATT